MPSSPFGPAFGDALNDDEFTRLLQATPLSPEAGFGFLSFCGGFVTLGVPLQKLADWYPEKGWILPEKESIAKEIARKYKLCLHEPPDVVSGFLLQGPGSPPTHHHLELGSSRGSIIIAHPRFLKVRLYVGNSTILYADAARTPVLLGSRLLPDLSALYRAR